MNSRRLLTGITMVCCLSIVGYAFYIKQIPLALLILFLSILFCICIWIERTLIKKECIDISNTISEMMDQKELQPTTIYEEYLVSKIQHQLLQLDTMYHKQHDQVIQDRDEIRLLINDIAHQLRTPLTNMKLYMDLFQLEPLGKKQRNYIHNIETSMNTITFLSESFIKMSRLEGKLVQLQLQDASIYTTLTQAIESLEYKYKQKHLHIDVSDCEEGVIPHDVQWMKEAFINVLDNAIKYSDYDTTITIRILSSPMFVQIAIEDEGIGIQKGEEHHIFKRFYRGKKTNHQEGYGLGLYISRAIIQQHLGFIKVKQKEKGTIFTILLPR